MRRTGALTGRPEESPQPRHLLRIPSQWNDKQPAAVGYTARGYVHFTEGGGSLPRVERRQQALRLARLLPIR
ncbi:hypothetical protein D187_008677 [Cystobacter fuscus DSM 2262]|uniref:Uncharacterized protein n=1 Tax=Cystobacter fuscus (strain ATCC 25194 / DSM 2262 / NBRC 100088 / M29) TaxID=1242864 RepID=S9QMI5_CYSF2|nr:hypothetical protein D187_008677 [Cystobacter fuscus DSM 2262]